ncbi:CYTH and CHAD domain-containing protein [Labrys wisconsinensis]|uniref:Inorganic triphosphatase YgiF n=1 Tax=Labrys wisconsinensis TaxID=425677 RepID=A0ABU0J9C3_9HYPH|nr:CYTH and CHAD domain-containing protein [Labrys wisconsinensis]MDQ0470871.1 inorganic triphosphatase YgiF [Labrys wisconsinensis]
MTLKTIAKTLGDLASSGLDGADLLAQIQVRHPGVTPHEIARAALGAVTDPFADPALPGRSLYDLAIGLLRSTTHVPEDEAAMGAPDLPPADETPAPDPAEPAPEPPPLPIAGIEVELKLVAPAGILAAIVRAPMLDSLARNRGTVRHLQTTYYDTPDLALRRAGIALRIRRCGRQIVQTLKLGPGGPGRSRREWEMALAEEALDIEALLPVVPAEVAAVLRRQAPAPVCSTRISRQRRLLDLPGGVVELAFDQGLAQAGERTAPIEEIELELKAGGAGLLYGLAQRLSELGPVRLSTVTKAERGHALLGDGPLPAVRTTGSVAGAALSTDEAVAAILREDLNHLLANQPVAEEGRNPDGVHQMRVALRRLRSALALLRPLAPSPALDGLRAEAKWLAGSLGDARNWDVFLADTLPRIAAACPLAEGFEALRLHAEAHREAGYAKVRSALADGRAGRFAIALGAWIEQRGWRSAVSSEDLAVLAAPLPAFAEPALVRHHRKALRRGHGMKRLSVPARHELRLAVKKLRYQFEFFAPLFAGRKQARTYARRLGRLQDGLGRYNDLAATHQLVVALDGDPLPAAGRLALGAIIGWQARDLPEVERVLRRRWRAFRNVGPPWQDA